MKAFLLFTLLITFSHHSAANTFYFVGTTFPSVLEKNEQGQIEGLGADIVGEICLRLGCQIKIDILPFKRALKMVELGKADAFIGPYKSKVREQYMVYSEAAFYQDSLVFYVKNSNEFQWYNNLETLKELSVGLTRGWNYGDDFEQYKSQLKVSEVGTMEASFLQLIHDRVDIIVTHPRAAQPVIKQLRLADQVKQLQPPLIINKGYFGFSKKRNLNDFITSFDKELNNMMANGEVKKMSEKYGLAFP
ncbi:substrate-binding periplasmic protein [Pseudoalteromonas arctica]|uniref:Amino acid ABC transporter substrate-binding protein n=1 Tax=Pseudoalteromonas arctica TaxID=394751 RepID=A0A7Y0DSN5_9GAMM|nr:transporter substrate-binding domain-containing protein [Pseudoalteromonas arctica]NMM39976.1 amino acid ABC transporter substrate-binding protein [Pseudoalteromonas arctica]